MNLRKVKPGYVVLLPEAWWHSPDDQVRALPGEIIDIDAPGEADLLAGQLHKFEPAPEGAVPTPIAHARVKQHLRDAAAKAGVPAGVATIDSPRHPKAAPAPAAPAAQPAPAGAQATQPEPPAVPAVASKPRAPARPGGQSGQPSLPTVDALPNVPR